MEERQAQLSCLLCLLQSQAMQPADEADEVQQQVLQYTSHLLQEQEHGKRKLLSHLLQLMQVLPASCFNPAPLPCAKVQETPLRQKRTWNLSV